MFTKGTKSVGKTTSKTGAMTRGRSKAVSLTKPGKVTKGRTKAVTAKSTNSMGTKATGSTGGVKIQRYSTAVKNPSPKRPVIKPLQLG